MTHAEIESNLPFYVNGTLSPAESAAVERELATCASCAADAADLRALRSTLREGERADAVRDDAAFTAIVQRIDAEPAADPGIARRASAAVRAWWRRPQLRAAALAACVVLVAFAAIVPFAKRNASAPVAQVATLSDEQPVQAEPQPPPMLDHAVPAPVGAPAAGVAKVSGSVARDAAAHGARRLARSGAIGLLVTDVPAAVAAVERIASANFGDVTGLEDDAPSAPSAEHTAHATLSVPDDRFAPALASLASLGGVTARSVTTEDLTDSIVDTDARLRNLRREETDLLRIMDRSGKVADILEVEQQLASTREEIERLDAQAQAMKRRVAYATIDVTMHDDRTAPVATPGAGSQLERAWESAQHRVWAFTLGLAARVLLLVAFAPYLALLAALVVGLTIVLRRRRR